MTTITKERLLTIKQWRETYGPGSNVVLPAEEAEELARVALTSLEAEPVAWECGENIILFNPDTVEAYAKRAEISPKPLFATPPVPVVPDDVLEQTVASPALGNQVSELTMWVKRLAHSLKYANSLSSLPDKAMEYLNQNGLISVEDVLR
ncbi:hypothetical protein E5S53_24585 [Escherichia coli]|uniref:hypothetical protein n=1 Tax=Escherichia coli TaxID=562 RepID=UPI00107F52E2|nr:hypothetical protein E5S55_24655 [Escherichia coli]TGH47920.1 hypothetical protein E5S53_24585 [Escherichia coli]